MRVWIRADGNEEIASGHLRRCLTIAEELEKRGAEMIFLLADGESDAMLRRISQGRNVPAAVLGIPYGNPMEELPLLAAGRRETGGELENDAAASPERTVPVGLSGEWSRPDWILVDSYAVMQDYFDGLYQILPGVRIAYIDDEMTFDPAVDLVVNYDPDTAELEKFYHAAERKLLGPAYVPLRPEFRIRNSRIAGNGSDHSRVEGGGSRIAGIAGNHSHAAENGKNHSCAVGNDEAGRILLSVGGSDPYGMAEQLERLVQDRLKTREHAEVNGAEGWSISIAAPDHPYVEDMAGLMRECSLAVSAAGTTLYELCAEGVPSISFSMADNQTIFGEKMDRAGLIPYAGDVREAVDRDRTLQKIGQWVDRILQDGWKKSSSEKLQSTVDGKGAERIAEAMWGMQAKGDDLSPL